MNSYIRTVTILFTDIENSTSLWEKYPEAMDKALAIHDAILDQAITANQGTIVKTTGDGVHAVFASAIPAINAVLAAQKALITQKWEGISPIKVRMALHTGEANVREGDYYGSAVNRAARMMSLAAGKQILLSGTTARLVRDSMPSETTLNLLGQYNLRGLTHPEEVYQLVHPALPRNFAPLESKADYPRNLPSVLTSFVGREEEVADICNELTGPTTRLLTLTGPGGVGKTRLSLQAANECLDHFADGTYFVPLAPIRDAAEVPSAMMQAIRQQALGSRPLIDQLKTYLEYSRTLIIIDNFEHVMEARFAISELLAATSRLRFVVTSRSSLDIYGEKTYRVAPLRLPEASDKITDEELIGLAAPRLFLERARSFERGFELRGRDVETVAQICTRLDGLPLAIELAAAQIRMLSPSEILVQLDRGLSFLRGRAIDLPARQQTLMATIQWSHDLLDQDEKVLFRRLAVFAGGFALESAEAVCAFRSANYETEIDVLDALARLLDHNLVFKSSSNGQSRYFMLETIHDYALEQLSGSMDEETANRNHIRYFLALAEQADLEMVGLEQRHWQERLTQEHENLRAALENSVDNDPKVALQTASALRRFWHFQGNLQEGFNWISQALRRHAELNLSQDAILARALSEAGNLAWFLGREDSYEFQQRSVALWRRLGDSKGLAYALWQLGKATWTVKSDLALARKLVQESASILRDVGDRKGL
ncbi:MAG: adenylate/guanylate cyclase domain-containing protein, partial [Chloroflexota bacterium]